MNLGYFDTISNCHIKILSDGSKLFFPQGALGRKGYVISSSELETLLRKEIRRYYIGIIVASGVLGGSVGPLASSLGLPSFIGLLLALGVLGWIVTRIYFGRYTSKMAPAVGSNSTFLHWRNMSESLHPVLFWSLLLICLLIVIGGLLLYRVTHDPKTLVCSAIFALILIPYCMAVLHRLKR